MPRYRLEYDQPYEVAGRDCPGQTKVYDYENRSEEFEAKSNLAAVRRVKKFLREKFKIPGLSMTVLRQGKRLVEIVPERPISF